MFLEMSIPTLTRLYPVYTRICSFVTPAITLKYLQEGKIPILIFDGSKLNPSCWLQSLAFIIFQTIPVEIHTIHIRYIPFDSNSVHLFGQIFDKYARFLNTLSFSHCFFDPTAQLTWKFTATLRHVRLNYCRIDGNNLTLLFNSIPPSLQSLRLSNSKVPILALSSILLRFSKTIRILQLENCLSLSSNHQSTALKHEFCALADSSLGPNSSLYLPSSMLNSSLVFLLSCILLMPQLTDLNLARNLIENTFFYILQLIRESKIQRLNLRGCGIKWKNLSKQKKQNSEPGFGIFNSLLHLEFLNWIDLSDNSIGLNYFAFAHFLSSNLPFLTMVKMESWSKKTFGKPIKNQSISLRMTLNPLVMKIKNDCVIDCLNLFTSFNLNLYFPDICFQLERLIDSSLRDKFHFSIEQLSVFGENVLGHVDFLQRFLSVNKQLKTLNLELMFEYNNYNNYLSPSNSYPSIEKLIFKAEVDLHNQSIPFLSTLLKQCPNLKELTLDLCGNMLSSLKRLITGLNNFKFIHLNSLTVDLKLNSGNFVYLLELASLAPSLAVLDVTVRHSDIMGTGLIQRLTKISHLNITCLILNIHAKVNNLLIKEMFQKMPELLVLRGNINNNENSLQIASSLRHSLKIRYLILRFRSTSEIDPILTNSFSQLKLLFGKKIEVSKREDTTFLDHEHLPPASLIQEIL